MYTVKITRKYLKVVFKYNIISLMQYLKGHASVKFSGSTGSLFLSIFRKIL